MRILALLLIIISMFLAQSGSDREVCWNAFITWFKTAAVGGNPLVDYAAKLKSDGQADAHIDKELSLLRSMLGEREDWIGIYFDKVFGRPVTGDPATDGFNAEPSALLVAAVAGLKPGTALDAGVGQGRNAVYLARQGWIVTGLDISAAALAATAANAANAGVRVTTENASYDSFAFGADRWDLIALTFAWAPVTDPAFVTRLRASLRAGGRIVFEHFTGATDRAGSDVIRTLKPNELRACFRDFQIARYEETEGVGDWGGPGSRLVRMVAIKR